MLPLWQEAISICYSAGSIFAQGGKSTCLVSFLFMLPMQS